MEVGMGIKRILFCTRRLLYTERSQFEIHGKYFGNPHQYKGNCQQSQENLIEVS